MGYGSAAPLPLTEGVRAAHPLCFDTFARQSIGSKRLQELKPLPLETQFRGFSPTGLKGNECPVWRKVFAEAYICSRRQIKTPPTVSDQPNVGGFLKTQMKII